MTESTSVPGFTGEHAQKRKTAFWVSKTSASRALAILDGFFVSFLKIEPSGFRHLGKPSAGRRIAAPASGPGVGAALQARS